MSAEPTISDLQAKVDALSAIVEKQSKLIGQTGQKLIEMQIRDTRNAIRGGKGDAVPASDAAEFATNDDLVQLVGELQGQLDELEERLIRRTFNIQLSTPEGRIAPLLNKEGDVPGGEFPQTVAEFGEMNNKDIIQYCVFYDVIVPDGGDNVSPSASAESAKLITAEVVEAYSQEEVDSMHDELARFLGLRFRKGESAW